MILTKLKQILRTEGCSLVIGRGDSIQTFNHRGVKDLYRLLAEEPEALRGASVADKVVGKGAAALMVLGGVSELYTPAISAPAVDLLKKAGVRITCVEIVPAIINRAGTGFCPVETLCLPCATAEECLPLIENFINSQPQQPCNQQ